MRSASGGLFIVVLVVSLLGCGFQSEPDERIIENALVGFEYAGSVPDSSSSIVGEHGLSVRPFPDRLVRDRQYVFHRKRQPIESWVAISEGLKTSGATVIDAPQGNVGLAYTTIGGPWFLIEFRIGNTRGTIQNRPAVELASGGLPLDYEQQDFVLRLK